MRARSLVWLSTCVLCTFVACVDLSGLAGGPPPSAGDDSGPTTNDDASISDASTTDASDDAPIRTPNMTSGKSAFLMRARPTSDASMYLAPILVEPGDGAVRELACPRPGTSLVTATYSVAPEGVGPFSMRVFYDPSNPASVKFVYPVEDVPNVTNHLFLARESSICTDASDAVRNLTEGVAGMKFAPTFSSDGSRIAYLVSSGSYPDRLITASTTGPLGTFIVRKSTTNSELGIAHPALFSDASGLKVAWVETDKTTKNVTVRMKSDRVIDDSTTRVLLDCGGVFPMITQIGIYLTQSGESVLLFTALTNDVDAGALQSSVFSVAVGDACATRQPLFSDSPTTFTGDFAVATDGERVAHTANRALNNPSADRNRIWIGTLSTRTRKACSRPGPGFYDQAPQWLAGGTQILWTRRAEDLSSASTMIANVSGDTCTDERLLAQAGSGEIVFSQRNGCSVGTTATVSTRARSACGAGLILALGTTAALRRRRRPPARSPAARH